MRRIEDYIRMMMTSYWFDRTFGFSRFRSLLRCIRPYCDKPLYPRNRDCWRELKSATLGPIDKSSYTPIINDDDCYLGIRKENDHARTEKQGS